MTINAGEETMNKKNCSVCSLCRDCYLRLRKKLGMKPVCFDFTPKPEPIPDCLNPDALVQRVCELERELAKVLGVLEGDGIVIKMANKLAMQYFVKAKFILKVINAFRAAALERIKNVCV